MAVPDRPPLYTPDVADLASQLPLVGRGLAEGFHTLAAKPSMSAANQVAAQLAGAQAYLQQLRAAISREEAAR